jgi:starvation-inducible DNA-binding protein
MVMDIGLQKKDREFIVEALERVLADSFILALKTQNYHWNVTGPYFSQLHKLFKELYEDLNEAGDMIAERIRALGRYTPGSYGEFIRLTSLKEEHTVPEAMDMVRQLVLDNEKLIRRLHEVYVKSESVGDIVTSDLMIRRMDVHSKMAWMLRSHLE